MAGPPVAGKAFRFVAADDFSHTVYAVVNATGVTQQPGKADFLLPLLRYRCPVFYSDVFVFFFNFSRAVGSPLVMDPNTICRKVKRLAGKQAELCQTQPEIVREVAKGARLGVRECQYQFRYRRWNCTSHNKYFGKILQQGEG